MFWVILVDKAAIKRHLVVTLAFAGFFRSPESKAPWELIVQALRRPSRISKHFSSKTTGPIATKFHIQPPRTLGKKSCSNCLGHMTNMAATPIYGEKS